MNVFQLLLFLSLITLLLFLFGLYDFLELFKFSRKSDTTFHTSALNHIVVSENIDFEGCNNETGFDHFVVPNIIHYIRFNKKSWTFTEYICLLSAYINHQPDHFFIHTNVIGGFTGKYWKRIQRQKDLISRIVFVPVKMPSKIFDQTLSNNHKVYHASDIIRIQALMKYGGIFFDNDVYIIQNLDKYRKFEMALGWPKNKSIGTMVLVANKNARFLPLWLDNYRDYKADQWYFNAGDNPTEKVLMKHPELVHREELRFGIDFMMNEMFQSTDFLWRTKLDTVHLLINHRFYLDCFHKDYRHFNERNILHYPFNFGAMARLVLNHKKK